MSRPIRHTVVALALSLGCAASVTGCTDASCGDLGTCAGATPPGTDAGINDSPDSAPPPVTNPFGDPYPTENLGWTPRGPNSPYPGNIVPNVVFEHLVETRKVSTNRNVRRGELAELYDPKARYHDVIVLILATLWDDSSAKILDDLGAAPNRTVVLTALGQSGPGLAPLLDQDFPQWANKYLWAWHAFDPGFDAIAGIRGPDVPIVALIDARTMELAYLMPGATPDIRIDVQIATIRSRSP